MSKTDRNKAGIDILFDIRNFCTWGTRLKVRQANPVIWIFLLCCANTMLLDICYKMLWTVSDFTVQCDDISVYPTTVKVWSYENFNSPIEIENEPTKNMTWSKLLKNCTVSYENLQKSMYVLVVS